MLYLNLTFNTEYYEDTMVDIAVIIFAHKLFLTFHCTIIHVVDCYM